MRPREVVLAFIGVVLTLVSMAALSACALDLLGPAGSLQINALVLAGATALIAGIGASSAAHAAQQIRAREQATRQAELALHESEARYRLIAEHASDLIALLDAEGRFYYASPSYARELGHAPSSLNGIVQQSGGTITVASAIGAGTTVTILLPRAVEGSGSDHIRATR